MDQLTNQSSDSSAPTEIMMLRPRQVLCDRVTGGTEANLRSKIEELAFAPNRWLSIVYPNSQENTNSPEAFARIMGSLSIVCYLNDLKAELGKDVDLDVEHTMQPIDYYFEVTHCAPYLEEYPHILRYKPFFYEPGINNGVTTALVYPKQELIERLAEMTGLTMEKNILQHIAQPILLDGKQDSTTTKYKFMLKDIEQPTSPDEQEHHSVIQYKCTDAYQKEIIHEIIGTMITLTLLNSDQKFEFPPVDTYAKWTEQLISMAAGAPSLDVVINSSNRVFWVSDPAEFR